ncbi:hypothetical protein D3C78_1583970 [compost metagenome]
MGFVIWSAIFGKPLDELVKEDDLGEEFTGIVDTLYHEKQNHNVKIAGLSNGYKYQINGSWENEIKKGDSLSKKKGSFLLKVYKGNGQIITLDYRNTYLKE